MTSGAVSASVSASAGWLSSGRHGGCTSSAAGSAAPMASVSRASDPVTGSRISASTPSVRSAPAADGAEAGAEPPIPSSASSPIAGGAGPSVPRRSVDRWADGAGTAGCKDGHPRSTDSSIYGSGSSGIIGGGRTEPSRSGSGVSDGACVPATGPAPSAIRAGCADPAGDGPSERGTGSRSAPGPGDGIAAAAAPASAAACRTRDGVGSGAGSDRTAAGAGSGAGGTPAVAETDTPPNGAKVAIPPDLPGPGMVGIGAPDRAGGAFCGSATGPSRSDAGAGPGGARRRCAASRCRASSRAWPSRRSSTERSSRSSREPIWLIATRRSAARTVLRDRRPRASD